MLEITRSRPHSPHPCRLAADGVTTTPRDTPRGLCARQLLPLCYTRRPELVPRGSDSLNCRSGDRMDDGLAAIPAVPSWAVPCPLGLPCLSERDEWPTTPVLGGLGSANTRVFGR